MPRNEATLDRIVRIVLGVVAIALLWPLGVLQGFLAIAIAAVGVILLVTGAIGFCPLYRLFGISTCPLPRSS